MTSVFLVVKGVVLLSLAAASGTEVQAPRPEELQAALARTSPDLLQAAIARTQQRLKDNLANQAELERRQQALRAAKAAAPQDDQLTITAVRALLPISQQLHLDMAAMHAHVVNQRGRARRRAARHTQQHLKATGELLRRRWRALVQVKRSRRAAQAADRAAHQRDQAHAARLQSMLDEAQTMRHLAQDTQRLTDTILASRKPPPPGGTAGNLVRWLKRLAARLSATSARTAGILSSWWPRLSNYISAAPARTAGNLFRWFKRISNYISAAAEDTAGILSSWWARLAARVSAAAGDTASFLPSWPPRLAQLFQRDALTQAGAEGQQHQDAASLAVLHTTPASQTDETTADQLDAPVEQEAASLPAKALKWLSFENPWCRTLVLLVMHVAVCLATTIARLRVRHNYCHPEFLFDHRHAD